MQIKFIYFSHQTLQVPRVARQCIVALCDSIAGLGVDTTLVSFRTLVHKSEQKYPQFRELYGVRSALKSSSFRILGHDNGGKINDIQRGMGYFFYTLFYFLSGQFLKYDYTVFSSRNNSILFMLSVFKKISSKKIIVIADVHGLPEKVSVNKRVDGNMCISHSLAEEIKKKFKLDNKKIRAAHGGVDIKKHTTLQASKYALRQELGLPNDKKLICYAGKVYYRYQEVAYMLEASKSLLSNSVMLVVGGREDQAEQWRNEAKEQNLSNIIFKSFVPPQQIPKYLRAADLLVMYYSPSPLNHYRSPAKLFDYLISGTPVIAADFDSTKEIITDTKNGFLVAPYSSELLAKKINEVLDNSQLELVAKNGIATAHEYSWTRRAKAFLDFANEIYNGL